MDIQTYSYDTLFAFSKAIFLQMGCSGESAADAARVLLSADLRGIDSHGIARLSGYVRLWKAGRVNTQPKLAVIHETPSTAVVDGDAGLGLVVAPYAMKVAMEKARLAGSGWVSVQNSNHFGIAGIHAMMGLEEDMIGIAMTNASPLVAPYIFYGKIIGDQSHSDSDTCRGAAPFVMDMATTTAANGKLEILQRKNLAAPEGWIQDQYGKVSTNQHEVKNGGALLPLGGTREQGSHKGYALGSVVDIFSAILSGANYGPWVPPFVSFLPVADNLPGKGIGHFFGAMRIDAFRPAADFKQHMDQWISRFRSAETVAGAAHVVIPGDPEREMEQERRKNGIPLIETVVKDIAALADECGTTIKFH